MPAKVTATDTATNDWFARIPWRTRLVVLYVAAVLTADLLATTAVTWPFHWASLSWKLGEIVPALDETVLDRFDLFKFAFWFVLPFLVCLPRMDWKYLLRGRWTTWDAAFVGALAVVGMAAMFIIPLVPELQRYYPGLSDWTPEARIHFFLTRLVWIASWLPGWEFLHRYVLLRAVQPQPFSTTQAAAPGLLGWAWLLVPVSETLYHLQKAALEAGGMFLLSAVLTLWCLRRRNWLIAFLVHLIIEVELLVFMTLIA